MDYGIPQVDFPSFFFNRQTLNPKMQYLTKKNRVCVTNYLVKADFVFRNYV